MGFVAAWCTAHDRQDLATRAAHREYVPTRAERAAARRVFAVLPEAEFFFGKERPCRLGEVESEPEGDI